MAARMVVKMAMRMTGGVMGRREVVEVEVVIMVVMMVVVGTGRMMANHGGRGAIVM